MVRTVRPELVPDPEKRPNLYRDAEGTIYVFREGQTVDEFWTELDDADNAPPEPAKPDPIRAELDALRARLDKLDPAGAATFSLTD